MKKKTHIYAVLQFTSLTELVDIHTLIQMFFVCFLTDVKSGSLFDNRRVKTSFKKYVPLILL